VVPFLHVLVYSFFPIRTVCPIQVPQPTVVAVFASYCTAKKPFILPTQCNCVLSCHSPNLLLDQLHSFCRSWRLNLLLSPLRLRRCHGAVNPPETPAVSRLVKKPLARGYCSKALESIPHPSLNLPIVISVLLLSSHLRSEIVNCAPEFGNLRYVPRFSSLPFEDTCLSLCGVMK